MSYDWSACRITELSATPHRQLPLYTVQEEIGIFGETKTRNFYSQESYDLYKKKIEDQRIQKEQHRQMEIENLRQTLNNKYYNYYHINDITSYLK